MNVRTTNNKTSIILLSLAILHQILDARIGSNNIENSDDRIINVHDSSISSSQIHQKENSQTSSNNRILNAHEISSSSLNQLHQIDTSDSSIVGGYLVNSPNTYPYIVSIMEVDLFTKRAVHSCAGSLIAPDVVLTAAHCVDYSAIRVVDTGRFSWQDDTNVTAFHVTEIYMHPEFYGDLFLNDVALLKLSGKSMVNNVAKLHEGRNMINIDKVITSIGWGLTSDGGYPSPDLRAVEVKIISTAECQKYYGKFITDTMICAYAFEKDACQGDSGGPAMHTDSNGHTYQVGIISWGDSCGKNPGVYTNLESPVIMNFINEHMCKILLPLPDNCINEKFYGIYDNTTTYDENVNTGVKSNVTESNEGSEIISNTTGSSENSKVDISNDTKTEMNDASTKVENIDVKENQTKVPITAENNETKVNETTTESIVKVNLCKNVDVAYCETIKNIPWFGCKFAQKKCPEFCCLPSCTPDKGCLN